MPAPATLSSELVGRQSMGFKRSSKDEDALNFHFLIMVQMMATPPTEAAMTIKMVTVVRAMVLAEPDGVAEVVAAAALPAVTVTFAFD